MAFYFERISTNSIWNAQWQTKDFTPCEIYAAQIKIQTTFLVQTKCMRRNDLGQFPVRPKQTNTKRIELCAAFHKEFKYSLRFDDFHIEITCNGFGETTVWRTNRNHCHFKSSKQWNKYRRCVTQSVPNSKMHKRIGGYDGWMNGWLTCREQTKLSLYQTEIQNAMWNQTDMSWFVWYCVARLAHCSAVISFYDYFLKCVH